MQRVRRLVAPPITFRTRTQERALIERASELAETPMSELARQATVAAAKRIIREHYSGTEACTM